MMLYAFSNRFVILSIIFIFLPLKIPAQINNQQSELYREIFYMDSILFDAYNNHNLEKIKSVFSKDMEFYHDAGGLTFYNQNMESFTKLFQSEKKVKRELVSGSMEVYPVKDYGAIEIGSHKFCEINTNIENCGIYKFVHIWKKDKDGWTLTRVISYGH
jgi:hypothetical protein